MFEGACDDGSTEVALPGRQPVFTKHLTSDQTELLTSRLAEYSSGKRSVGVQTDNVIMFSDTNELKKAGQVPTSETGVNTNSCDSFNQYDSLRLKIDEIISILTNDINKKLEDLLSPQSISFLPTSTPLHDHSTMRSQKNAKNGAVKTLLLPDVPLGQPLSEDELTGLTDVPLNSRTGEKTHAGSGPVTDSFQSSVQTDFSSVVTTALAQNGVACHSVAVNVPANNVCSLSPIQSSVTAVTSGMCSPALTDNDLAPLDLSSSTVVHSSVTNPIGNSTPALVGNDVVCVPSNQIQNGVACFPHGVTSSSSIRSNEFPVPVGVITTSSHNSQTVEPGCVSVMSSTSHYNNTAAVLGTVNINPPTSVHNSIPDVTGDVNSSSLPFTAFPLGASSSPLISLGTRPQMLLENQVCNFPVGAKLQELSQSGVNSQSAGASIPAFSQINDSSLSVDRNSIANQICIPSASIMASSFSNAVTSSVSTDVCQNAISSFQITESCDLGQSNVCSQPVSVGSSYLSGSSQIGNSSNSSVGNSLRPSGDVEAQARQPLSLISHGQLNRGQNYAEIRSVEDMKNIGSSCKVRIAREHMRSKKASSAHVGSFAWHLTQDVFTANELEGRNFNGNYGKQGLSPRRKEAIEEAIHDMYGSDEKHIRAASKAINSGIRGKVFRASNKNTVQNSAVSSWPAGVNLAGLMQLANIPTLHIHPVQNNV